MAGLLALVVTLWPQPSAAGTDLTGTAAVRCQLPPQIRRLGRNATYLAAGRVVQTSAADCRLRGGQATPAKPGSAGAANAVDGSVAVMVGGDRKAPACPVSGEIAGLQARSTLSVRSGPATSYPRIDRLGNGRRVHVCDGSADEAWLGVVYPATDGQDCGVAAPIRRTQAYAGACQVGWVSAGWVRTGPH